MFVIFENFTFFVFPRKKNLTRTKNIFPDFAPKLIFSKNGILEGKKTILVSKLDSKRTTKKSDWSGMTFGVMRFG